MSKVVEWSKNKTHAGILSHIMHAPEVAIQLQNDLGRFLARSTLNVFSLQARSSHRFEGSNEPPFVRQVSFFFFQQSME